MAMKPMSGCIAGKTPRSSPISCHFNGKIILVAVCAMLFALTGGVSAYSVGDGSAGNPYEISNPFDLVAFSGDSGNWSKHFILTTDISLSAGSPTETIGNETNPFMGTFDGNGKTISDFTIDAGGSDNIGLFGILGGTGKIRNVQVKAGDAGVRGHDQVGILVGTNHGGSITNCSATGDVTAENNAGGLVGKNSGTLTNCSATGNATADKDAGGLVGSNQIDGTIENCSATGSATAGDYYAGGLVGRNYDSVTNCSATGDATAGDTAGGLVGYNYNRATVTNCSALGIATADNHVGGLVGSNYGPITNSSATGIATAHDSYAGGLVGHNYGPITNCSATGNATADKDAGGLVGLNWDSTIENCSAKGIATAHDSYAGGLVGYSRGWITTSNATGDATADSVAGGLIGHNENGSTIANSFATGVVTAVSHAGGLVGDNKGLITNCSATGNATADKEAGGLVGYNYNCATVTNCSALGIATADYRVGGLVGSNHGSITDCSATGIATAHDSYAGGLVGHNYGPITNCSATGNAKADVSNAGGLVGYNDAGGIVTNCSSMGNATAGDDYAGGLVGYNYNRCIVTNCSAMGDATATGGFAGGLVGRNDGAITNCSATGNATAMYDCAGGLVGWNDYRCIVTNCSAMGDATANRDYAGGLVGLNGGTVTNCSSMGNATATRNFAGGLVGRIYDIGIVTNCSSMGDATATRDYAGGLVGRNDGAITNCYATGIATAMEYEAGGLVGHNEGTVTNCYATGNARSHDGSGGLVGYNDATITTCYATGNAIADESAGGLVGENHGTVANCFGTGNADAVNAAGGLAGSTVGTITNCYATGIATATNISAGGLVGVNGGTVTNCFGTGIATATNNAGGLVGYNYGTVTNGYRHDTQGDDGSIQISNLTKFMDYDFLTRNSENDGLNWSPSIISTSVDPSIIWRVSLDKNHYPIFQWGRSPVADFIATPLMGYAPLAVTFTDNSVGSPYAWLWNFGDGETSAEQNPVHIYQRSGSYTVSLTATNAYGDMTAEKTNYIGVRYYSSDSGGDTPIPAVVPTAPPVTPQPTAEPTVPTDPTPGVPNPDEFTETAQIPVDADGAAQRSVTLWVDERSGFLTVDAGVVARDASGTPQETISIVAVPVSSLPSPAPGEIGSMERPGVLYAFDCGPDGMTFSPAISLSFVLSQEEWERYGEKAEVGWFNSATGVWEVVTGVADADTRTITIQISHFSTYALFAQVSPEVPLPDVTKVPGGQSDGSSLWLFGGLVLVIALGVAGYLAISRRKNK